MDSALLEKLICINCNNPALQYEKDVLICPVCGKNIPINDGIPDFLSVLSVGKLGWQDARLSGTTYDSTISQIEPYRLNRIDKPMLERVEGDTLEIGCGTCRLAAPAEKRGARYFGLDPALPFLRYAYNHYGLGRLVRGQGERLPFRDGSFDRIISGYFAYRNVNPALGLPEARRVLKKGGGFVFDLLNHWILKFMEFKRLLRSRRLNKLFSFRLRPSPNVFEFLSVPELKRKAKESGFSVENIISTPIIPVRIFSFIDLNKSISKFYYRGKKTIYLGYDVIIVLKAV